MVALGLTAAVCVLQLFVTSLGSFFDIVLSAAGFFLLAEFFLDSVTGVVFLTVGHNRLPDAELRPHGHPALLVGALFSSVVMGALLVAFFIYGPEAIGGGIDQSLAVLLAAGLAFAWWTRRRAAAPVVFAGRDVTADSKPAS